MFNVIMKTKKLEEPFIVKSVPNENANIALCLSMSLERSTSIVLKVFPSFLKSRIDRESSHRNRKVQITNELKYVRARTNKHSSHWHYVIMVSLSYHSRGRVQ